jgi:hypothetical protein
MSTSGGSAVNVPCFFFKTKIIKHPMLHTKYSMEKGYIVSKFINCTDSYTTVIESSQGKMVKR